MNYFLALLLSFCSLVGFSQLNIQSLGHYTFPNGVSASNLTGYVDSSGNEYALVGTSQGLSIINISNPANPVQSFFVPGAQGQDAFWREVREYKGYAYVTTEQQSGLVVVNLTNLPDSIQYQTINPGGMQTSHTIFIDENGIAYINGTNQDQLFLDCNANPWSPPVIGDYTLKYVHDCFVRNDTMWLANINDGVVTVVDVTNKSAADNPANTLAEFSTPLDFSHNTWLSDDSRYLFTTDEKPASHLTCYDVSNLNNITETDRTQVDPGSNTIIHNTYFLNDYCITSYYTYGITIHDVARKNNLVEVGNFDSSPAYTGDGFHGAWGVWPYLPSGNIIISDIETGLWIVKPTYKRAAYLEGVVRDSVCNTLLNNVKIEILNSSVVDYSKLNGSYSTGIADSGTYTIRFTKAGYQTYDVSGVNLDNGFLTTINVNMVPAATSKLIIRTVDSLTGNNLPFTRVRINDNTETLYQEIATNTSGEYEICDFVQGNYRFYAGRWGRNTAFLSKSISNAADTVIIPLSVGYYDDFIMNYGWTVTTTATKGAWERAIPEGTTYQGLIANANVDVTGDYGQECFVTGNGGGSAGDNDLDGGYSELKSPLFDLTSYTNPYISFYTWFFNDGGQGTDPNDSLIVYLSNGFDTVEVLKIGPDSTQSEWVYHNFRVEDLLFKAVNMRIFFRAEDYPAGHLVEAAVDKFMVVDSPALNTAIYEVKSSVVVKAYPNPFNNEVNLYVSNAIGEAEVKVINGYGQTIFTSPVLNGMNTLALQSNLSIGVYLLQVTNDGSLLKTIKLSKTE